MLRIRNYIRYLEGEATEPKMADRPEEEPEIDLVLRKDIADLLKKSHDLSNDIYQTEQEIKNLGVCITYAIDRYIKEALYFKYFKSYISKD